jgi:hypothetical protein
MKSVKTLLLSAAVAAATILTPAASQARPWGWHGGWGWHHGWHRGWGPGWGWGAAGVGLGLAAGAALASPYHGPRYAYGYGYRPCVRRVIGPYGGVRLV